MKSLSEIELELSKLGIRNRFWGKPEVKELAHILNEDETITTAANGRYQGGLALIVTTNHRLLLVDKKLWFMSLEDVRFDMITEVDYSARLFDATISVRTINKVMRFTSFHQRNLRDLTRYLQAKILEIRQMTMQQAANGQGDYPAPAPVPVQLYTAAPVAAATPQPSTDPTQPAPSLPLLSTTQINYNRPSRLRRVGTLPTASFTMQQQHHLTARR